MAQLEQSLGNAGAAGKWEAVYRKLKDKINERYWDEQDGFYYDVAIDVYKRQDQQRVPLRLFPEPPMGNELRQVADQETGPRQIGDGYQVKGIRHHQNAQQKIEKAFRAAAPELSLIHILLPPHPQEFLSFSPDYFDKH